MLTRYIQPSNEVAEALAGARPVVALESTLITHGLPYPLNLETALGMEAEVRACGAVPATIAVLEGTVRVGLSEGDLSHLAQASEVLKVSSRGLAFAVATGRAAATTVSGTMWAAGLAGIRFFATGGIGGVHRGAGRTGDISTDLIEISRTSVAVICAGAKSILDIGRTLEHLETLGVPVFGYRTEDFPGFFTVRSGYPAPHTIQGPAAAAEVFHVHRQLALPGGVIFACPPPTTVEDEAALERAVTLAVEEAEASGIRGADVTPFLLSRVAELSDGASLRVNLALLRNNARVAAEIAVAANQPREDASA